MVNIQDLIDDAKYYETVRTMRWPDEVLLLHRGDQGRAGRHPTAPPALPMPLMPATLRRPHRHDLRRPPPAAENLDHLPVPDGAEPLRLADRQGARYEQGRRPGVDPITPPGVV